MESAPFDVAAESYDRFMGRFSRPLATELLAHVELSTGDRVLDVGCGPGALTAELVRVLGESAVTAIDPSEPFVAAVRQRFPGVDARPGTAENLPFESGIFDATLAELVVHFMSDPVAGIREMARVTRPNGTVAACVWDFGGDHSPLGVFWRAAKDVDVNAPDESARPGTTEGDLERIFAEAGIRDSSSAVLTVNVSFATFADWWQPFTLGVGPAGAWVAGLDDTARAALAARCAQLVPSEPFSIEARAWSVVGHTAAVSA